MSLVGTSTGGEAKATKAVRSSAFPHYFLARRLVLRLMGCEAVILGAISPERIVLHASRLEV